MKIRSGVLATLAAAVILSSPVAAYAMAVSAGGGGPAAYTTSTSLTSLTENPSDCTATPGATPVQTGQVVGIPCAYPVTTTVVTSYTLHSPSPRYGPRPVIGYGPRPIVGYGPAPIIGYGPKPIIGYGPRPVIGYGPRPIVGYGPRPVIGYGPRPIVGYRTVQTGPYHRTIYHTVTVRTRHKVPTKQWKCFEISGRMACAWVPTGYRYFYTTTTVQVPYTITYYLTSQVPAYGAAPPIYGAAPPIYGKAPPLYGAAPPIYGSAPPIYGPAPPIYGAAPPIYGAAPIIGYTWTASPAGSSTRTSTSYQSALLFATPLGGGGGSGSGGGQCGPGHCGPYYIIPIPVSGN